MRPPAPFFPVVANVADSAIADFNNDGRMDLFLLGNAQLRPSSVVQEGANKVEALLANGGKGFKFVSSGPVTFAIDWNAAEEGGTTDLTKIQIGANGTHPNSTTFTLDPADPTVAGMPRAITDAKLLPIMQIGYDPVAHRWTLTIVTKLTSTDKTIFSQGYLRVTGAAPITNLVATGLWPTDTPGRPTLLMNVAGQFADQTVCRRPRARRCSAAA